MKGFFTTPNECISRKEAKAWFDEHNVYGDIDLCIVTLDDDNNTTFAAWRCLNKKTMQLCPAFKDPELQPQAAGKVAQITPIIEDSVFASYGQYYTVKKGELLRIDTIYNEDIICQIASLFSDDDDDTTEFHLVRVYPTKNNAAQKSVCCWSWLDKNKMLNIHPVFMEDKEIIVRNLPNIKCEPMVAQYDVFERDGFIWRVGIGDYGMEIMPFTSSYKS